MFDVVFTGGRLFTSGWDSSRPGALAVADGRIVAAGAADRIGADAREIVDLQGGLLIPSFLDAHAHPVLGGVEMLQCDLTGAADAAAAVALVAVYAAANPAQPWILGGGWTMAHFPGGRPTRQMLDAVVSDRPAALQSRDHHGTWANSAALHRAGITASSPDPADGIVERDAHGEPTGYLHEGASNLLYDVLPQVDRDVAVRGLLAAQDHYLSLGITGWQDAWVGSTASVSDIFGAYVDAVERDVLRARVTAALWWERDRGAEQIADLVARRDRLESLRRPDVLRSDHVKIMIDGVVENFTAALSHPYLDGHGHATGNLGLTFVDPAALPDSVAALDAAGFSVHFHALGDRAVTAALDALDAIPGGPTQQRHQLAHLQFVAAQDVPRFARLGAIANLQTLWAALDEGDLELTRPFVDDYTFDRQYPLRELRDSGARLAQGSDWPVTRADPFAAIHVAVNRAEIGRTPDPILHPEQAIDLATSLAAYTAGSAAALGYDDSGRLEVGALADLAVLDRDPFGGPADEIARTGVRETWLGGERVWAR